MRACFKLHRSCVDAIIATISEAEQRFGSEVGLAIFDTYSKGIAAGGGDEDKAKDQCSQPVEIFCRAARFAFASLFCRNFSTQIGVSAATTAVSARSAASLLAVPPVTQPLHENPMTMDATAPIAIPTFLTPISIERSRLRCHQQRVAGVHKGGVRVRLAGKGDELLGEILRAVPRVDLLRKRNSLRGGIRLTPTGPSIAPSLALFLVLGFSILARSCEAMILAFKGAEYAAD